MRKYSPIFFLVLIVLSTISLGAQEKKYPDRLKRSDSYLGIHFDFHAGDDCTEIGKTVTQEMVASIIDQVKPDYIQVDCKGHRGLSSYPTKVGNQAPGFVKDALKIFREVTAEKGVALYCHYSGVLDNESVKQHPQWAILGPDGEIGGINGGVTSVFGPYVDELLIPQLKELNDLYQIDGVWIDGECWGMERDYRPEVVERYKRITGNQDIPKTPEDPDWHDYSQFFREGFRQYVNHYVDELHAYNPQFQLASNWAYSSFMPEPVTIDVDFLSGDITPNNSINAARLESRILAQQGVPWDLMAWSFSINWSDPGAFQSAKSTIQLKQEAAEVLSQGGGFQVYFNQRRDASVVLSDMKSMSEIAKFCRERQPFCHQSVPLPQIGLILSTDAHYKKLNRLFQASYGEMDGVKGTLQILLENQHVVDVVMEQNLEEDMNRYPLLIYPEWETITPNLKQRLIQYVEKGGNLLVTGPVTSQLFEEELGVELLDSAKINTNHLCHNEQLASVKSLSQRVKLGDDVIPFGRIYGDKQRTGNYETAGSIRELGKGKIAGIYLNVGARYLNGKVTVTRDYMNDLVEILFPDPMVRVHGSRFVDLTLNRIGGTLAVNLVNTAGPHANSDVYVYDEIPSIGPLTVVVKLDHKPARVSLEPSKQEPDWQYADNQLTVTLPRLELYEIIWIEE